jgi:hypothetical protein
MTAGQYEFPDRGGNLPFTETLSARLMLIDKRGKPVLSDLPHQTKTATRRSLHVVTIIYLGCLPSRHPNQPDQAGAEEVAGVLINSETATLSKKVAILIKLTGLWCGAILGLYGIGTCKRICQGRK